MPEVDAESSVSSAPPEDVLRILVATDCHLGYLENDPERGDDSFVAFEEVLQRAVELDVDLVLLAGDLFDHARPSPSAMLRAARLLRRYCFGDKPVAVETLSDQQANFGRVVNYEDPDLNVSYPVLSVHGNHDDPVGRGATGSLDVLSSAGLINYFGKWGDYERVEVEPVLLRKGATRLALFGLGHLKDRRLARLFRERRVEVSRPPGDDWFNLMVLHQNRADRGPDNYVSESCLPDFLDLVVWGHEHDCRVQEEFNGRFYVTQPGSTVATSLAAGEALPKHCALLQVHGKRFKLTPLPLRTVRPFVFHTIVLADEFPDELGAGAERVQELLTTRVNDAVREAEALRSGDPRQPALPLVRLNVLYDREDQNFNRARFGRAFDGQLANPDDVLNMKRERRVRPRGEQDGRPPGAGDAPDVAAEDALDVAALLQRHYASDDAGARLVALSARAMADAVRDFTGKRDDDSFRRALDAHRRHCLAALTAAAPDTDEAVERALRAARDDMDRMDATVLRALLQAPPAPPAATAPQPAPTRGGRGGRGRGRAARAASPPPAPAVEPARRTPRRSAAQKAGAGSWLQEAVTSRSARVSLRRLDDDRIEIDDSD